MNMATTRFPNPNKHIDFKPGMCLIEPNLPFGDGRKSDRPNFHPFIVLHTTDTHVTCVMARSLHDPSKLERIWGARELYDTCPPMSPSSEKRQYIDTTQTLTISKNFLNQSPRLELCHEGGSYTLHSDELKRIQQEIQFSQEKSTYKFARYYPATSQSPKRPVPPRFEAIDQKQSTENPQSSRDIPN